MTETESRPVRRRTEIIEAFYAGDMDPDAFERNMGGLATKDVRFPVRVAKADKALLPTPTEEQSRGYKYLLNRRK